MIRVNSYKKIIAIDRAIAGEMFQAYYLILHNNYTKEIWLFKVIDDSIVNLRYAFHVKFPDEFKDGEYNFYLVSATDFDYDDLSSDYPDKSVIMAKKEAITIDDMYIIFDNKMLVTNKFKAKVYNNDRLLFDDTEVIYTFESKDKSSSGYISKQFDVLSTGLLRYDKPERICCETKSDYEDNIEYNTYNT